MTPSETKPTRKILRLPIWLALACSISLLSPGCLPGCSPEATDTPTGLPEERLLSHEAYRIASLPSWFAEELFDEMQAVELYANEEETVFGLNVSKNTDSAFSDICASMEEKGWIRIESGLDHCSTFIRKEGVPSWALVSCTSVGDSTCIVACIKEPTA